MYEIPATNEGEQSVLRNREAMQTKNRGRTALSSQRSAFSQSKDIPMLCRFFATAGRDFCVGGAGGDLCVGAQV